MSSGVENGTLRHRPRYKYPDVFFFQIFRRFRALDKRDVKQTTSLLSLNPRRKTRQVPERNRPVMIVVKAYVNARAGMGGGGNSHMKQTGMLVGSFGFNL